LELQRQNEEIKLKAEAYQIQLEKEREETRKKAEEDLQILREEALGERERLRKEAEETPTIRRCTSTTGTTTEGKRGDAKETRCHQD